MCGNQARVRLRLQSPGSSINLLIVENTLDVKQISCPNIRGDCRIKLVLLVNVSFVNTKTKDLWLITQRLIPLHWEPSRQTVNAAVNTEDFVRALRRKFIRNKTRLWDLWPVECISIVRTGGYSESTKWHYFAKLIIGIGVTRSFLIWWEITWTSIITIIILNIIDNYNDYYYN